ncbi:surface antigen BspA-like [Trichomonas vaginalis G3]|uniref:Surface antigen BspA-like n=1 Tax=Trichomonas vaginalis (strain ATCC PRA-98 / G3) TaxID=412133 RepID=A2F8W7_TRIV3|nr:surface antigen family [Trichomonas vaginalis G3]EAX98649.1 surface antigen BspA-like [Trichomonas vaginalis G3]KAI5508437.1 surface antigen family [Trichomonas vaginalis G3]|eukprot:XP_001311579.1 surface antigen BspA-like [Trichomonas vaginalis G3]
MLTLFFKSIGALNASINSEIYESDNLTSMIRDNNLTYSNISTLKILSGNFDITEFNSKDFSNLVEFSVESECFSGEIPYGLFLNHQTIKVINISGATSSNEYSFANCQSLEEVYLQSCVSIGQYCLSNNAALVTIYLPSLTTISPFAFYDCSSLKELNLPNLETQLTTNSEGYEVGNYFSFCTKLKNISLPKIKVINGLTFHRCQLLEYVYAPDVELIKREAFLEAGPLSKTEFNSVSTLEERSFYTTTATVLSFPKVTSIGDRSFGISNIQKIYLEKCETIGVSSFERCVHLSEISCPAVKVIKSSAFTNTRLINVVFPQLTYLSVDGDTGSQFEGCHFLQIFSAPLLKEFGSNSFKNCISLESFDAQSVVEIGNNAFYNCQHISKLKFPNLEKIGIFSFANCSQIENISFNSLTEMKESAFESCKSLKNVEFENLKIISTFSFRNCVLLESVDAKSVEEIGDSAFFNCQHLFKLKFSNLQKIGVSSFENCSQIEAISIPTCIEMKESAFENCKSLKTAEFNNLNLIPAFSFRNCDKLSKISFDMAKSVANCSFYGCSALQTINFPNLLAISGSSFENCHNLARATLPLVTVISEFAFKSTNLTIINFPKLSKLYSESFMNCKQLTKVNLTGLTELVGDSHFSGCSESKIFVLSNLQNVSETSLNIFDGCVNMDELYLGDKPPKEFNEEVFKNFSKSIKLHLPNSDSWKNYVSRCKLSKEQEYIYKGIKMNHYKLSNHIIPILIAVGAVLLLTIWIVSCWLKRALDKQEPVDKFSELLNSMDPSAPLL